MMGVSMAKGVLDGGIGWQPAVVSMQMYKKFFHYQHDRRKNVIIFRIIHFKLFKTNNFIWII
jgi:hypothetical protein